MHLFLHYLQSLSANVRRVSGRGAAVSKLLLLKILTLDLTNDVTNFKAPWEIKACCSLWWFTSPFGVEIRCALGTFMIMCAVNNPAGVSAEAPCPPPASALLNL